MRAHIWSYDSADVDDLDSWLPADPKNFGFQLTLSIGTSDWSSGEELFQIVVCTPEWRSAYLEKLNSTGYPVPITSETELAPTPKADGMRWEGGLWLLVETFEWPTIWGFIEESIGECDAADWSDLAHCIERFAAWEFHGYEPPTRS